MQANTQTSPESRTKKTRKQSILALGFQAVSVGVNFLIVPVTISFLNQEVYGIWITLLSIISWISLMDLGIGLGLRNKLSESLAQNDYVNAKKYISTAYVSIIALLLPLLIIGLVVIHFLNWNSIFNVTSISNHDLVTVVSLILTGMVGVFILSLVNQVLNAVHKNAFVALHPILLNVVLLIVLSHGVNKPDALVYLSKLYVSVSLLVLVIITSVVFYKYKELLPKISCFDRAKVNVILNLGFKFFIIQIATVVIFSTDNLIITQTIGPKEVTGYQVTRQVFGLLSTLSTLIMGPLWAAYTHAYVQGDFEWIRKTVIRLSYLMLPLIIGIIIIACFFNAIISIWIKEHLNIDNMLIILMGVYTVLSVWNNIFGYVLGGIGKIRLGTFTTTFSMLINIPLCIFFVHRMGVSGVILGTICSIIISSIISPIQVYYFLFNKKKSVILEKLFS